MSDVFNTSVNKQQISHLLFDQDLGDDRVSAESLLHPVQPNKTYDKSNTAEERADKILSLRLRVFEPRLLQENLLYTYPEDKEELGLKGVFQDYVGLVHEQYLKRVSQSQVYAYSDPGQFVLPAADTYVLPYYKPRYTNKKYDEKILNQIAFEVLYNKIGTYEVKPGFTVTKDKTVDDAAAKETLRRARTAAADFVLSTGSFNGQLNRLAAMRDIRQGLRGKYKPRTLQELGLDLEDFSVVLQETLPIKPVAEGVVPLMYLPSKHFLQDEEGYIDDLLPKMKLNSKAGPPFPSRLRKGDVYTSIVYLADHILNRVGKEARKGVGQRDFTKIINEEPWVAMAYLFPKEERYMRSEINSKTRNIFSASGVTHLLNSMISDPIMSRSDYNLASEGSTTPSLQKFTPYFGNIDTFLNKMVEDGTTDAIYADNWYVSWQSKQGRKMYYSLDLEKGEAQATPDLAAAVNYYLLTRGWITDDNYVAFNQTWASYALNLAPACVVDAIAVWYNFQLRFPGQGSGNTFTFLINQATTTKFRYFWQQAGSPCPSLDGKEFTPEFRSIMEKTGVNWKIELFHQDLLGEVERVVETTPSTGFLQDDTQYSVDENGQSTYNRQLPRLRLDILGYDAVYSNKLGRLVPVLAEERFYPSMLWPRKDQDDIKSPLVYRMYRLLRYEVLRVMGGFSDPITDQALSSIARDLRSFFDENGITTSMDPEKFLEYDDLAPSLSELFSNLSSSVSLDRGFMLSLDLIDKMTSDVKTKNKIAKDPLPAHLRRRVTGVYRPRGQTAKMPNRFTSFKQDFEHIIQIYRQDRDRRQIPDISSPDLLRTYAKNLTDSYLKSRTGALAILQALGDYDGIVDEVVELLSRNTTTVEREVEVRQNLHLSLNRVLDSTIKAVKEAERAVDALLMQDPVAEIKAKYVNTPAKAANPTIGSPGNSSNSIAGVARSPPPRDLELTKSQKKNLKNRTKERERKAILARQSSE